MLRNQIKTFLFLAILTVLLLGLGQLFGGRTGLLIGLLFAIIINFGSYWYGDKIILAIYKAQPASKQEYPEFHEDIENICKQAKIIKPQLFIVPSRISNAFATGRGGKHAAVAITHGILNELNREELKGVLAHEVSHIKNKDMLIQTIAATIAGVISYLATMARFAAIFGTRDEDSGSILGLIVASIIAPIAALLIQLAISRSREFIADESAAKLISNSQPLASALLKLENAAKALPLKTKTEATAPLFIVNPFRGGLAGLFATHPPIQMRVEKLRDLKL